jgi:hypothetical protein
MTREEIEQKMDELAREYRAERATRKLQYGRKHRAFNN